MIGSKSKILNQFLNDVDKKAFEAWATQGSLVNARRYFIENKILSPQGRVYSVAGIRYCAMRHMVRNYEDALSFILDEYYKRGIHPDQDTIEKTMVGYAIEVLKYKREIYGWATDHNLLEKFQEFIDDRTIKSPLVSTRKSNI